MFAQPCEHVGVDLVVLIAVLLRLVAVGMAMVNIGVAMVNIGVAMMATGPLPIVVSCVY